MSERIVLHADMDAFYASIEQRDHPELRGRPVIVGASSARGVVSAASYEARVFGVRSAMPGFRARELCPQGVFLRGDMQKYVGVSEQVHGVFAEFTPMIEPLALDEAFLDVTASVGLFGGALELGKQLRARVREVTQLTVSCGIAPNKLVAKIACSLGKPDGLRMIASSEIRALLDPLPVRRLWGVGPESEQQLTAAGFFTFADLANADLRRLRAVAGDRAENLRALARGEDDRPVESERAQKSCGEENTFEHDVSARDVITQALTSHAQTVARRIRSDALVARTVTLKIKLGRSRKTRNSRTTRGEQEPIYQLLTRSKTLQEGTDDGSLIRKVAIELWDAAKIDEPVRLLGVSLSNLAPRSDEQLTLFGNDGPERKQKLGPALDAIRKRFGDGVLQIAGEGPEKLTPSMRKKRGV